MRQRRDGRLHVSLVGSVAEHRHSTLGKVRHRKARRERQDHVMLAFEAREQFVETLAGLDECALRWQAGKEVERLHCLRPRRAGDDRFFQEPGRACAGGGHVDVRVRAIGDQPVGVLDHRARHVGVQVEARHHRNFRPDDAAHARQQFAFAIVEVLGDHRAVQVEVDAVDAASLLQPAQHFADDPLVRVARDVRGRRCRAPCEADGSVSRGVQRVQRTGRGDVGARQTRCDGVAERELRPTPAILERGIIRLRRRKGVGLVLESAYRDDSHSCSVVRSSGRG